MQETSRIGSRFVLQPGVTGLAGPHGPPPLSADLLDRTADGLGYRPVKTGPASYRLYRKPAPGPAPGFLLLHRLLPLVAFAAAHPPGFADDPDIDRLGPGLAPLRVLMKRVLDAPIRPGAPDRLPAVEQARIAAHRPATLGEMVFNRWP